MNFMFFILLIVFFIISSITSYILYNIKKNIETHEERKSNFNKIEQLKKIFIKGDYCIYMEGPKVRIKSTHWNYDRYTVFIEWIDKNHSHRRVAIQNDIEKLLKLIK